MVKFLFLSTIEFVMILFHFRFLSYLWLMISAFLPIRFIHSPMIRPHSFTHSKYIPYHYLKLSLSTLLIMILSYLSISSFQFTSRWSEYDFHDLKKLYSFILKFNLKISSDLHISSGTAMLTVQTFLVSTLLHFVLKISYHNGNSRNVGNLFRLRYSSSQMIKLNKILNILMLGAF